MEIVNAVAVILQNFTTTERFALLGGSKCYSSLKKGGRERKRGTITPVGLT